MTIEPLPKREAADMFLQDLITAIVGLVDSYEGLNRNQVLIIKNIRSLLDTGVIGSAQRHLLKQEGRR